MTLDFFPAPPELDHLLYGFFYLDHQIESPVRKMKIIPALAAHITFFLEADYNIVNNGQHYPISEQIDISGQQTHCGYYDSDTNIKCLIIAFHSTGLYRLLGLDMSQLTDKHLPLHSFLPQDFCEYHFKQLKDANYPLQQVAAATEFLKNIVPKGRQDTGVVDRCIELIQTHQGTISIQEMSQQLKVSERYLQKKFRTMVGVSPGLYNRLYRFYEFMQELNAKVAPLPQLMKRYGYYDYSHFKKEFIRFMHDSPVDFASQDQQLITTQLLNAFNQQVVDI